MSPSGTTLTNGTVLSFGQDRGWRRATRAALDLKPGERVLDLAAGTGVSTVELGRSGAWVVATDFSTGMLKAGSFRQVPMVAGDAMNLPFADAVFDAATISFGLRNVSDFDAGLREIARVTRPGGRLVVSEFSTPSPGAAAHRLHGIPDAGAAAGGARGEQQPRRVRLPGRIDPRLAGPEGAGVADRAAGWKSVRWRSLTGGIVAPAQRGAVEALHSAVR